MLDYVRVTLLALMGVCSHILFFRHGEHHMQAPKILRTALLSFSVLVLVLVWENGDVWYALKTSSLITTTYCSSLFFSMTIYRLFFHQLRRFPGPISARISKIGHVASLISKPNFLLLDELHRRYGDFVRTGPNELSICTPAAMIAVHGPGSKCNKAPFYDLLLPRNSIVTTRERSLHDSRRRIWDQAFRIKAVRDYEGTVVKYCQQLQGCLVKSAGQAVNVSELFHYFAFDVMGELCFGKSFNMLKSDDNRPIIRLLANGMQLLGLVSPTPWLARIGFALPGLANGWKQMFKWSDEQMQDRLDKHDFKVDITSWLIDAMELDGGTKAARDWLDGDGFSIIIAGSDTTSSALIFIFYYLACYPKHIKKIRSEVDKLEILTANALQSLPYLNGVINEALRLHPPVPSAGLRQSPAEGLTISGTYIPGNTTVVVPLYSLHRLESCFARPFEFKPEHWFPTSGQKMDKDAFAPFFRGRYGCVGKNLALLELLLVTAMLSQNFYVTIARPFGHKEFLKSCKDHFTAVPGELNMTFKLQK